MAISSNDQVKAYKRFIVYTSADFAQVKPKFMYAIKAANVKTKLYGVRDTDDGIKHTKDRSYVSFVHDAITSDEIKMLAGELAILFDDCEIRTIYSRKAKGVKHV